MKDPCLIKTSLTQPHKETQTVLTENEMDYCSTIELGPNGSTKHLFCVVAIDDDGCFLVGVETSDDSIRRAVQRCRQEADDRVPLGVLEIHEDIHYETGHASYRAQLHRLDPCRA